MSAAKKLPKGLPALPPLPDGYGKWEYMGREWRGFGPYQAFHSFDMENAPELRQWRTVQTGMSVGNPLVYYIRAVKRPAKKAAKAKPGKVVTAELLYQAKTSARFAKGAPVFVLPADAESVAAMVTQCRDAAFDLWLRNGKSAKPIDARTTVEAVLASIGISAKGAK